MLFHILKWCIDTVYIVFELVVNDTEKYVSYLEMYNGGRASVYGVYILQLVRYSRACAQRSDIITWRVSYKNQELFTFLEHLGSSIRTYGEISVALRFSFLERERERDWPWWERESNIFVLFAARAFQQIIGVQWVYIVLHYSPICFYTLILIMRQTSFKGFSRIKIKY